MGWATVDEKEAYPDGYTYHDISTHPAYVYFGLSMYQVRRSSRRTSVQLKTSLVRLTRWRSLRVTEWGFRHLLCQSNSFSLISGTHATTFTDGDRGVGVGCCAVWVATEEHVSGGGAVMHQRVANSLRFPFTDMANGRQYRSVLNPSPEYYSNVSVLV